MNHTIEERLARLEIPLPDGLVPSALAADGLTGRGSSERPHRWRARTAASVATLALVLGANTVVMLLAPGYGTLLADAPGLGELADRALTWTGLRATDVVSVTGSARSSDYEVRVLAVYADATRTVVLMDIDDSRPSDGARSGTPEDAAIVEVATLVGPDGTTYGVLPSAPNNGRPLTMSFEPLARARPGETRGLTLQVKRLMQEQGGESIDGDWQIPLQVTVAASVDVPLPADGTAAGNLFTFTSATLSGRLLTLRWEVSGPTIDEIRRLAYPPQSRSWSAGLGALTRSLRPDLAAIEGGSPPVVVLSGGSFPAGGPATGELVAVVAEPGLYQFLLGETGAPVSVLAVP